MSNAQGDLFKEGLEQLEDWSLDEAEQSFKNYLIDQPENAEAHNKLGVVYARKEQYEQAAAHFEAAINYDPHLVSAYSNLGSIYLEQGEYQVALEIYQKSLEIDPENSTVHHNLGVLYKRQGDLSQGVKHLKKATALQRKNPLPGESAAAKKQAGIWFVFWIIAISVVFYMLLRS